MKRPHLLAAAVLLISSPALAVVSVTQNNVQVPTTGTLSPFDFLNDGTNSWPLIDLFDGTTHGTFDGDGGFLAHISNSSIAVTGTFWQTTQPISAASGAFASGALAAGSIASGAAVSGAFVAGSIADLAHGQGTMAASVPVAIASNQSAVPASESGTWNITNVSGTVSLPTGAATSANQPSNAAQGSTTSGQTGGLVMGAVTTGGPTYTTAQTSPLSLDTSGNLRVNVVTGGGGGGTSSSFGSPFPATGTALGLTNGTNMVGWSAASNYGTSPGAIAVPAVNASVTNAVTVAQATAASLNATVVGTGTFATQSAITAASGSIASGAIASGAAVSGAFVAGSIADLAHGQGTMAASVPVAIASNQSTLPANTAQVNGVTTLTGTGAVGTGAQRIAVGTDTATIAGSAPGTAGSASANVLTVQGIASGTALAVAPNPYPAGSTPITASATGTTTATTATLTNVAGHTTYVCGFSIRANATAAATGNATVTGTISGTLNFTQWTAPNASGVGVTEIPFSPCVPASGASVSIAVVSAAAGAGGVISVTAWGYSI